MKKQFIIEEKITFEPETFRLMGKNKELTLSHKEAALLCCLCENSMTVMSRSDLINTIWGGSESSDIGLNKTILMVRRKFESLGILNAINTISRVGYMLRLEVKVLQYTHSAEQPLSADQPLNLPTISAPEHRSDELKPPLLLSYDGKKAPREQGRRFFLAACWQALSKQARVGLVLCLTGFTTVLAFYYNDKYHEHTFRDLAHKKIANGEVLYTKDVDEPTSLEDAMATLPDHAFWMMISKSAISYIHMQDNKPEWQKLFFIDENRPLAAQVQCVVEHIGDGLVDFVTVAQPVAGMDYIRSYIYSPCINKKGSDGLGELFIRYTQFPDKAGITIQNVSFLDMDKETVFKFKKVSEYHADFSKMTYAEYNRTKTVKHAKTKSIMFSELNQRLLQSNPLYARILEELTPDDKYIITLDNKHNINADSTFDGMLYFDKIYNESMWSLD
ncbi:helix-turn-helix domain-containing protein [bacterium 19CA06SA08-2]|uniref:Helix-turn-helix domain-containing protein n=1 Tax=bacterium 19CA06SA08-2 TaxID=2920658 RepID=A0AAU6U8K2_UNCXX